MRALFLAALILSAAAIANTAAAKSLQTAIFAGGCFWCVEADMDKIDGVVETVSGFTGGRVKNPSYKQVVKGGTGHYEAVEITYDADVLAYEDLVHRFLRSIDPLDGGGQFCDRGASYRSAIFAHSETQQRAAEASKQALEDSNRFTAPVVTEVLPAGEFYPAEGYHQNYYQENPLRYRFYRANCGRDARLEQLWGAEAEG